MRVTMCVTALAWLLIFGLPQTADAERIVPPPVPPNIEVPAGTSVFLVGHAVGTQNYICQSTAVGVAWTFLGPQATLFDDADKQVTTHFLSPNPIEGGLPRPTWQSSQDTSAVWGLAVASSSDPAFVAPGAIPWLLLQVVGAEEGPRNGDRLSQTTWIHRLNTVGGVAPATGCSLAADVGKRAFAPYSADYFLYEGRLRD